jgi:hypothetical protein
VRITEPVRIVDAFSISDDVRHADQGRDNAFACYLREYLRGTLQLVAPARADLRALAGDYRSSEIDASYDIASGESGLMLQPPGPSEAPLKPFGPDAFTVSGMGVLNFFRDSHGQIAGFTVNRYNLRGLRFDRFRPVH